MRGKHLNSGIRGGIWDEAHLERMGPAIWLFGWLVHRQTRERNGIGLVLGGMPLTYEKISADTGMAVRTLKRWMARLNAQGYIRVKHTVYKRMIIQICKAKKFGAQQLAFPHAPFFPQNSQGPLPAREPGSKGPFAAPSRNTYREFNTERHVSPTMRCGNDRMRESFFPQENLHETNRNPNQPPETNLRNSKDFPARRERRRDSGHCSCEECRRRNAARRDFGAGEIYGEPHRWPPAQRRYSRPLTAWERREEETRRELYVGLGPQIERK